MNNLPPLLEKRVTNAKNVSAKLVIKRATNFFDKDKPIYGDYRLIWSIVFEKRERLGRNSNRRS